MAASKGYFARANYRFFATDHHAPLPPDTLLDLEESDIWNSASSPLPDHRNKPSTPKIATKFSSPTGAGRERERFSSLPVNIPDWSQILKSEYRENERRDSDEEDEDLDDRDGDDRVPPHEYIARQMARTRIASFSVHEGIGRTLKGRDLSRVRTGIWEKIGFQD